MLIKHKNIGDIKPSEITPQNIFKSRRKFMGDIAKFGALSIAGGIGAFNMTSPAHGAALSTVSNPKYTLDALGLEAWTNKETSTQYNNFYEFGTGKGDPYANAQDFNPYPWTVEIAGEVAKPGIHDVRDLMKSHQLEERVYRFRCVEAWSMVVPWVGVSLGDIIRKLEPTSKAKYVAFETLYDPERMTHQKGFSIPWPYVEGLRMDEAMNDLTLLTTGMYGEELPNQNGAPIRLIVPWKYGFKSIKSIVKITFTEEEPPTSWNKINAREYGFYSNVNPQVSHPRWSQSKERIVGGGLFSEKQETLMFNGYADQVADMYAGMDLKKNY